MSTTHHQRATWVPLCIAALFAAIFALVFSACNKSQAEKTAENSDTEKSAETKNQAIKVLYVTHEPGRYHDYTAQRKIFEGIAKESKWDLSVISASHDELITLLATTPDFGKDADVIVYNICMAKCDNPMVPYNIMQQTEAKGKPALLIHCALHSFWPTFKEKGAKAVHAPGANKKAHTKRDILEKWQKDHPNKAFPSWPNFTGIRLHSSLSSGACAV